MRTLNGDVRGTGLGLGRGRETPAPPLRARTGPLAAEQASGVPEFQRGGERQGDAQRDAPAEQIPGQTELALVYRQPTLWSL